jgi:hypothetical protein
MGGRVLIEQFSGGPTVDVPAVEPGPLTETCCQCGRPASGSFTLGGDRTLCRVCFWQYPYATTDTVPPGFEQGGTGI